ncbi:hypothetical protein [Roseibium sp. MMSF_3544]|uniref:hypothetical protein n=1 Tax=unclassified Roseibium TaxID=2629323 RepID=UPI00273D659C|nr:hypothetical protein [Roseibium sp. MMSF_3544]
MTVAAMTDARAQILGDGATDRIDLTFQFVDENDLLVVHTDANGVDTEWTYQQSPGSWYFSGGNFATGTIHFTASDLLSGERLTVVLTSRYDQPLSLDGGEIDPSVLEKGMDRTALQVQSLAGEVSRSLRVSPSLAGTLPDFEVPDLPEGYGFVRSGDGLVPALIDSSAISTAVTSAQSAQAAAETARTDAEAAKTGSETAATAAVASETSASTAATSAAGSATVAATSALEAAQSAADAVTNATSVLGYGRIPVGAAMPWPSDVAPNSFWIVVKDVDQTFSRATYPQLLDVYAPERTVTITSGSPIVTGIGSSNGFAAGMAVEGDQIPAGTTILSVDGASQVTLSANAMANSTTCRVFPFGNGDGSTTANFPNFAGRTVRGWDPGATINPDMSGALGTQEDAFPDHIHPQNSANTGNGSFPERVLVDTDVPLEGRNAHFISGNNASSSTGFQNITDGVHQDGTVNVSSETRGKGLVTAWIVKVSDGIDDPTVLAAVAVVQNATNALSKANVNETKIGSVAILQYQQPLGTDGGLATNGSRQTYPINTEVLDPNGIVDLSSFQFVPTVPVLCFFKAGFYNVHRVILAVRNVTDGVDVGWSINQFLRSGTLSSGMVLGSCLLKAGKIYELQYQVEQTRVDVGLGIQMSFGNAEIYGEVMLRAI